MNSKTKLTITKLVHTLVWLFFNIVIFYMFYAVVVNRLDNRLWLGYGLFLLEGFVLFIFKCSCPITLIARKYSISRKDNFDIYLPNWLAKHTIVIYSSLLMIVTIIAVFQLLK
jgi:hypothetical protein